MSKQSARRHRDGRYLNDYVIEDGGEVRVPVQLCDSMAGHRRGYAELSWREIADRRAAFESRQQMIDAARSAWQDGKRRRERRRRRRHARCSQDRELSGDVSSVTRRVQAAGV